MKRLISLFLALIMIMCSIFVVSPIAYAEDYSDVMDEYGYIDGYSLPDAPYNEGPVQISPTTVKISWHLSKMSYCHGFEIAQYNTSSKKYSHVAYVAENKTSYTVSNLKKDTLYNFAVRAYINVNGKKYFGEYSKAYAARTSPAETSLSSVKYVSDGKMKVSWKKVSGVSGYIIKYSTSSSFKDNGTTCTLVVSGEKNTSKTISGLAKKKYYVKVSTYKTASKVKYMSDYSRTKTCTIKKGVSLKSMLNAIKTDTTGKKAIKEYTNNGVDISKYNTTYDRVKAIYNWHSKHNTDYGWSCVGCNSNFNSCIAALFSNSNKKYDIFITLEAGNFKNNNGKKQMHKWSVIYIAGSPYIFDPRLQGYTSNKTGTTYFGITKSSSIGKKYLYEYLYSTWYNNADSDSYPFYEPFVYSVAKPGIVTAKAAAKQGAVKLTWDKISSAKGYQIQYSAKSDFSSSKSIYVENNSTVSKTLSNLGSNKTYYVRIRAYKLISNTKLYGFWSSTLKVKTRHINEANPTSIKKLTAKSKGFNIQWKTIDNATGYQVCYSKNSNFKKSTTKTYGGKNTSSKTISKLSAKTKYYVKVRTYRTVNGKKYYSAWSAVKTIKTK